MTGLKKSLSLILVASSLALTACDSKEAQAPAFNQELTLTISSGKVLGNEDKENQILEWLGIPYAQAPTGDLRWKAPQKVEPWTETFDAREYGDNAIQLSNGEIIGSEDALNLDVVRPATDSIDLPVIVFIHGGNNQTGTSQEIKGNTFVNDLNAVYVSVNYRLGALGFNPLEALKTGTDEENSGNFPCWILQQP